MFVTLLNMNCCGFACELNIYFRYIAYHKHKHCLFAAAANQCHYGKLVTEKVITQSYHTKCLAIIFLKYIID